VAEVARREAGLVLPAARRAAGHGIEAFLKKFSEEYAKERRRSARNHGCGRVAVWPRGALVVRYA
jgi:hypothetical protein